MKISNLRKKDFINFTFVNYQRQKNWVSFENNVYTIETEVNKGFNHSIINKFSTVKNLKNYIQQQQG